MDTLELFALPLDGTDSGSVVAEDDNRRRVHMRLIPWNVPISHKGQLIQFDRGSVEIPAGALIPLTLDHGNGALERIGRFEQFEDREDGLYAVAVLADTTVGRDALTLLLDGLLDEVSAGVRIDPAGEYIDAAGIRHRSGALDHGSLVASGAFGRGGRVLAVHNDDTKGTDKMDKTDDTSAPDTKVETFATRDDIDRLETLVAQLQIPGANQERPRLFSDMRDFVLTLAAAAGGDGEARHRLEEYALASDTTTSAAGIVPDYQSREVIQIVDTERPFVGSIPSDPIGDHGMSAAYPKVTQSPTVDAQSAENAEVDSTQMTVTAATVDFVTYAGASKVARQLIERSQPSFVDAMFREYAAAYAQKTEAAAIAAAIAGATGTAVLADLGASASATRAAINTADAALIAAVRRPATHIAVGSTRWAQLNNLVDSTGRPLLVFPEDGPRNADGTLSAMTAKYRGKTVLLAPDAGATDCLLYVANRFAATLESDPVQPRAEIVSTASVELGVYGLFALIVKHAGGGYTLTAS